MRSKSQKQAVMPLTGIGSRARPEHDERAIRLLRTESNAVIAAHDAQHVADSWMPTIHVSVGDGQPLIGRDAVNNALKQSFQDSSFIKYHRATGSVVISDNGFSASESGEWLGHWSKPDGTMEMGGGYFAVWRKIGGRWQVQSELFATLRCTGSSECDPK